MKRIWIIVAALAFGTSSALSYAQKVEPPEKIQPRVYYSCDDHSGAVDHSFRWKLLDEGGRQTNFGIDARASSDLIARIDYVDPAMFISKPQISFEWPRRHGPNRAINPTFDKRDAYMSISADMREGFGTGWKQMKWTQTIVDRNKNLYLLPSGKNLILRLPNDSPVFMYMPYSRNIGINFGMPVDDLLAWANGAKEIVIYTVGIAPAKREHGRLPGEPFGERRVLAAVTLNMEKIVQTIDREAESYLRWEKSITDFKKQCERKIDTPNDEILVVKR